MSKSLGTLTLDLIAKIGGFTGPLDQSGRAAQKWRRQIEKDAKAAGIAMGAAGAAAAAGLGYMIKASIDAADAASKAAQSAGLTTEAYTSLAFAADMSGVSTSELDAAMSRLNRTALEVAAGSEKQAALFKTLGVSVKDAGGALRDGDQILMDLADRFAKMPDGIGKSSLAMEVFGRSGTKMIPLLNSGSEGIKGLTEQARALGLVINDEQAKSAERFNDNLSILAGVSRGAGNVIAGELLPVMNDFTAEMVDIAIKGELAASAGDTLATSLKALAATGVGVYASFQLAGKGIAGLAALQDQATQDGAWYEKFMPPVAAYRLYKNWQGVKDTADVVMSDLDTTAQEFADILDRIWEAGKGGESGTSTEERLTKLKTFLADFSSQTDEGARAARKATDAIESQIKALQLQADTVAMTSDQATLYKLRLEGATEAQIAQAEAALSAVDAFKVQMGAQESYLRLLGDLRTEEEMLTDQMRERLAVLDAMQGLDPSQRMMVAGRIAGAATSEAPSYRGLAPEVGGAFGELLKIDEAQEKLQEWYDTQLEMLEQFRAERADLSAVWDEEELALKRQHEDELARIEQARQMAQLASAESLFGDLAGLTKTFAGEQSGLYKAMFAVQKAAAIAQSAVAIQQGIAMAAANPWPANLAAMASVAAATASIVSNIGAIGMAHDGIDAIPETGTWLLQKGERVTTAETSAKLDKTLEEIQKGGPSGTTVNVIEDASKRGTTERRIGADGREEVNVFVSDIFGDGPRSKAIAKKFGLVTAGT
ncbi:hypothetical protein [Pseudomonas songnenensis]|uniref:Phage tail tape measure protein n=1 Tax=Pseudomonas songnenensis TaxID=1176259 RepID=A0A482U267_9PSED|nr:hypothetical protein [Pseudomonas songnenensis]RYJ61239.1 hypothetical protein EJA06_015195 [Pseudomonas songnenensis]